MEPLVDQNCETYLECEYLPEYYFGKELEAYGWYFVGFGLVIAIMGGYLIKKGRALQKKGKVIQKIKK